MKTTRSRFKYYRQLEEKDCGPTCLRMLCAYYGRTYSTSFLAQLCFITRLGTNMQGLQHAAQTLGFDTLVTTLNLEELLLEAPHPCILHWRQNHFVVFIGPAKGYRRHTHVCIADPERGKFIIRNDELLASWIEEGHNQGYALLLEPTQTFYALPQEVMSKQHSSKLPIWQHLYGFRYYFAQIGLAMLLIAGFNLFFPLITRTLVDVGIAHKDFQLISMLLLAQLALFAGGVLVEFIRSWSVLYINARLNIQIISDFLIKLIRLPIGFFDNRMMTDIMLRIDDHERIEAFLSSSSLQVLFSLFSMLALSLVFFSYSPLLFLVFLLGSVVAITWVSYFLQRRKQIDYNRFELLSHSRNLLYEIIDGMCEVKLNNAERVKRFAWEKQQVKMYDINRKSLELDQLQHIGFNSITQIKSLLITFLAAYQVVEGQLSLGVMLSISMLVGQLNQPLAELVEFFQSLQNARISLDRLNDVYNKMDEDDLHQHYLEQNSSINLLSLRNRSNGYVSKFPQGYLRIENLSFGYSSTIGPMVINQLNVEIPLGKVSAIVGSSGSGKTTLFKLLLKFYEPAQGGIYLNGQNLQAIHPDLWRQQCGVVMQDGYIFSDSILRNVAVNEENPDGAMVRRACQIANIHSFVESLPLAYATTIGGSGISLSAGQRQRILIARAVYKNPDFLFFDEATSALDSKNERIIVQNLRKFYQGKTVLIIAHRLSTVRDADQIIVLEKGQVIEHGQHNELAQQKGTYFDLVKNQLELGT